MTRQGPSRTIIEYLIKAWKNYKVIAVLIIIRVQSLYRVYYLASEIKVKITLGWYVTNFHWDKSSIFCVSLFVLIPGWIWESLYNVWPPFIHLSGSKLQKCCGDSGMENNCVEVEVLSPTSFPQFPWGHVWRTHTPTPGWQVILTHRGTPEF